MKYFVPLLITAATIVLIAIAWVNSGGMERERMRSSRTPEEAVRLLLTQAQARNWDRAHALLANASDVEKSAFVADLAGSNGSLLTFANLENFDLWPLHKTDREASMRVKLHYSTAVGPLEDVRDLKVQHEGETWRVVWPTTTVARVAPQVIPVNYLRWDVINRSAEDDWGVQNVDSPQVRILSMNALQRPDRIVIVGEVVNEDTVPAYVNVGATLLRPDGSTFAQESSFDKISHTLLPKQVSPYRIDFPEARMNQVKSVRMDVKSLLVAASADPVIEVSDQRLQTDALGKKLLLGQLLNQSGQVVNIPHVVAAYYDDSGKVIWVSDGYVDQALLPQIPVPFAVDLPDDVAPKVHNYHVSVNYFNVNRS
jgi:hypothetical protein